MKTRIKVGCLNGAKTYVEYVKNKVTVCKVCGECFYYVNKKVYCSKKCADEYHLKAIKKKQHEKNLSRRLGLRTGETGTINEMLVAIDLIKNGYKVFMPFDTTSPYDILALKNGSYKRIQVKTGNVLASGTKSPVKLRNNEWDIVAVVYDLEAIEYEFRQL